MAGHRGGAGAGQGRQGQAKPGQGRTVSILVSLVVSLVVSFVVSLTVSLMVALVPIFWNSKMVFSKKPKIHNSETMCFTAGLP